MMHSYLVLDCAQIDRLTERLFTLQHFAPVHLLYQKTAYAALADSGPVLIPLQADSVLARAFSETWRDSAGIWLESDAPQTEVIEHLRSLIHARLEADVQVLLRYYDPRISRLWLGNLQPVERDRVMGPIRLIRLPDAEGNDWVIHQQDPEQPCGRYAPRPWLHLTPKQLEHLDQARQQLINRRIIQHCEEYFPEALHGMSAAEQQQWAAACRQSAARHAYDSEGEALRWVSLYARLGTDFPDLPQHQPYRDILKQRETPAARRLELLIIEQMRQHLLDQEVDA